MLHGVGRGENPDGAFYAFGIVGVSILVRAMLPMVRGTLGDAASATIPGGLNQLCIGMLAAVLYARRRNLLSSPVLAPLAVAMVFAWIVSPTIKALVLAAGSLIYLQQS